jgi:hypothetical protein
MRPTGAIAALACALAASAAARAADVDVELVLMGVGGHVRPGDPTAILVRATSSLTAPVQARIEWSVRNADGDTVRFTRDAALAPGAPVERWVYGVMPIVTTSAQGCLDAVSAVRVVEVEDGRAVRVLGERRIDGASGEEAATPVETLEALVGLVGDGRAGLSALATPTPNMSVPASMNELTKVARGIEPARMPDRWEGWTSFDTVIWTNAPVQNLGVEQARALLDWVRRGGNLVLVLPESGDPWGLSGARGRTALAEALPERAERRDAVEVSRLTPVLIRTGTLRNTAARTGIWTFPNDPGNGFVPILALPARVDARSGNVVADEGSLDGRAVAVRRPLGFGFVTVVGIDVDGLERRSLVDEGLPQADVFWNRILGRRADAPVTAEVSALVKAKRVDTRGGLVVTADGGRLVNGFVGLQSRAAIGVLGLLGAFALYWALAGPVPWFALRRAGKLQYAWLAYVAVAAAATTLAWIAIGAFELTSGRVQHLTFVDRVERPGATEAERASMRASAWFSAALPGYGASRVELERGEGAAGSDILWSWFPPPTGLQGGFPDTETYEVAAASQAAYELPARATSTVLAASWMGRARGRRAAPGHRVGRVAAHRAAGDAVALPGASAAGRHVRARHALPHARPPDAGLGPADHRPERPAALVRADGAHRALVAGRARGRRPGAVRRGRLGPGAPRGEARARARRVERERGGRAARAIPRPRAAELDLELRPGRGPHPGGAARDAPVLLDAAAAVLPRRPRQPRPFVARRRGARRARLRPRARPLALVVAAVPPRDRTGRRRGAGRRGDALPLHDRRARARGGRHHVGPGRVPAAAGAGRAAAAARGQVARAHTMEPPCR